ncbi:DUF2513 domain-containing protein [Alkalihalophilus marmarensis]|uniref:DUF2513 domain-containing protein n=1 Tax=Alkalihalophilus marmarensis TaxID=521377 RepID=UPI002E231B05|nr:DUF2513 domain-containing protein [Alkalihalophilus marmarensis]
MKREKELLREILLLVEDKGNPDYYGIPSIPHYSREQVEYHVILLRDTGFLKGQISYGSNKIAEAFLGLTPEAHDALEAMRDKATWERFKKWTLNAGGTITVGTALEFIKFKIRG